MKTIQKYFIGTLLVVAILFLSCQHHPTQPENGEITFNFKLVFAENQSMPESHLMQYGTNNTYKTVVTLEKRSIQDAVDMGHVMVLDLSEYEDMQEFRNSDDLANYLQAARKIEEDSVNNWSQWKSTFKESFSIVDDQNFSIENDTAFVTVTGVAGLNYLIIALSDNDRIRYKGEDHTHGEDETIWIYLYEWEYYVPPEEPQEEGIFEVIATISVGENPDIPALSQNEDYLYVVNQTERTISVISTASNSVVSTLQTGYWPMNPVLSPDGDFIWVPVKNNSRIDIISTATNTVVDSIVLAHSIGNRIDEVAFSPDGTVAFTVASDTKNGTFIEVDTREVLKTIDIGDYPNSVVADKNNEYFFVQDYIADQIIVVSIEDQDIYKIITTANAPEKPTLTPDGTQLYIPTKGYDSGNDIVQVIDISTLSISSAISVESNPQTCSFTSDGEYCCIPHYGDDSIIIFDMNKFAELEEIKVGKDPYEGTVSRDNEFYFSPSWQDGVISVISVNNQSFVENITCGQSPQKPVMTGNGTIYTSNYNSNTVTVIRQKEQ